MCGDACIIGRVGTIFRADEIIFLRGERRVKQDERCGCFALTGVAAGRKLAKFNVFFVGKYVKVEKFLVKIERFLVKPGGKYIKAAEFFVLFGEFNDKVWKKDEKAARFLVVLAGNGAKGLLFCVTDARVRTVAL